MQIRFLSFIKNRSNRFCLFFLILYGGATYAAHGKMPLHDTEIELPDGRRITAVRNGEMGHCLVISAKGGLVTLGRQCFELEYDRIWQYAFFVPLKKYSYVGDLNRDGNPEIAIATWDGGNNITNRYALVFSVKGNKLVYFTRKKFNLEFGDYLFD